MVRVYARKAPQESSYSGSHGTSTVPLAEEWTHPMVTRCGWFVSNEETFCCSTTGKSKLQSKTVSRVTFYQRTSAKIKLTHKFKAWILYKIPQLYPIELQYLSLLPILLNYVFYFFDMTSGLKVIKIGNDCVTLHFA